MTFINTLFGKLILLFAWFDISNLKYFRTALATPELALESISIHERAMLYIPDEIKDWTFCLEALKINALVLEYLPKSLLGNRDFVKGAVKLYPWALDYAAKHLRLDRQFILQLVQQSPFVLKYANEWQRDKHIVVAAIQQNGMLLKYASEDLMSDPDVILAAQSAVQYAATHETSKEGT